MKIKMEVMKLNHYSFWTAYYLARVSARDNPNKVNPYLFEWPEHNGWKAGIESIGVKK